MMREDIAENTLETEEQIKQLQEEVKKLKADMERANVAIPKLALVGENLGDKMIKIRNRINSVILYIVLLHIMAILIQIFN